jgi:hypothetical protein
VIHLAQLVDHRAANAVLGEALELHGARHGSKRWSTRRAGPSAPTDHRSPGCTAFAVFALMRRATRSIRNA